MTRDFVIVECEQRTPAWYQARCGLLTGSCADAVIAERKRGSGELAVRGNLRRRIVSERITGLSAEDIPYLPAQMQRGQDFEEAAFAAYEAATGLIATRVGFIAHTTLKTGCSPDGYVGDWEGVVELKCPKSMTHLEYLTNPGKLPELYQGQVLHTLWLTGAKWCDFCSFDDRYPESMQLFRVRVERKEFDVMAYDRTVRAFLAEVDQAYEEALKLGALAVQTA